MLEFLFASILAALIWLIATSSPCEAADWVTQGIPAWMQGIGTLIAVGIAVKALTTWRDQEQSKRKGDAAERLWTASARLMFTMRACRRPSAIERGTTGLDRAVALIAERGLDGHFEKLNEHLAACQFELVATDGFFPKEVSQAVASICNLALELEDAWKGVMFASKDKISAADGPTQLTVIRDCLQVLGSVEEDGPEHPFGKRPEIDAFEDGMKKEYAEVLGGLQPYVMMTA